MITMATVVLSDFDPDPTLEVGEDSIWRYRGWEVQHQESLRLFKTNLRSAEEGEWRTWWGSSSLRVVILGPPLVVKHLKEKSDGQSFVILLDTLQEKEVSVQALRVVGDRLALCLDGVLGVLDSGCATSLMDELTEKELDGQSVWQYKSLTIPTAKGWHHPC